MAKLLSNNIFYDELAFNYDEMISFDKAVERKKGFLKKFITPGMTNVADLGCGSGVDSIALTSLGLKVTAFEPSAEMLEVAKRNTEREKVRVTFHNNSIDSISEAFDNQFDLVVSLGNTFANIEREQLLNSLQRTKEILRPQGIILIQILNYEKILSEKQRIVNITKDVDKYFIRFYDFVGDEVIFNILIFKKENPSEHKLIATKLCPHTKDKFNNILNRLGFLNVEYYSDFNLTVFDKEQSKDLIIRVIKE